MPKLVKLKDWNEFGKGLNEQLRLLGFNRRVLVRNFSLETAIINDRSEFLGSTDRLELALQTGTDRDEFSFMWNEAEHDYNHDRNPIGKNPSDIIYAFSVQPGKGSYDVYRTENPEKLDLTTSLSSLDGILIYDPAFLQRVSKNEYWFLDDPKKALLLIFLLED